MKNILLTIMAMLIATTLKSAEIIPVWNKVNEAGIIHDMEFLRGENQFILLAGLGEEGTIQIRDTQTGELVSTFPIQTLGQFNQIEITPDSNRCIITTGGNKQLGPTIELRNLSDYSVISKDSLIMDDEVKDPQGNPYYNTFHNIIVDPIRPLVYVMIEKTNFFQNEFKDRFYLKVFNYETMEIVKDLTPAGYEYEDFKCFDVSDDGKYLAALNEGKSYLKIWDLESYELIKDYQLYDSKLTNPKDYRCEAQDIEFSSIDDDLIYFSGYFPTNDNSFYPDGIFKYSFNSNSSIKIELDRDYAGNKFLYFDDENRIFNYNGNTLYVINQSDGKIEFRIIPTFEYPMGMKTIFSSLNEIFIGFSLEYSGAIKYDSQTNIENNYEEEIIISPNPTTSSLSINLQCEEPIITYQISNYEGLILNEGIIENNPDNLKLDFTQYLTGIYFLTVQCNNQSKTYKIVKEG